MSNVLFLISTEFSEITATVLNQWAHFLQKKTQYIYKHDLVFFSVTFINIVGITYDIIYLF